MSLPLSREEFRDLVHDHAPELTRYAAIILTGDADGARDVVQDAFLRLWQQPPAARGNLRAWLFAVCRTRSIDLLRRRGRWVSDAVVGEAAAPDDAPGPASRLEAADRQGALMALVATLPPKQREVVRLKFQNDLSYAEIAEVTGLTSTHVGFLLHTALQTLKTRAAGDVALRP